MLKCALIAVLLHGAAHAQFGYPLGSFASGLPASSMSQDFQPAEDCLLQSNNTKYSWVFLNGREAQCPAANGKGYRGHLGEDWAIPKGTDVYAIGPGTIVFRGNLGGSWGNVLLVRHELSDGVYYSLYGHLESFNVISQESIVDPRLKPIGKSMGIGTGYHLHLEVKQYSDFASLTPTELAGPGYTMQPRASSNVTAVTLPSTPASKVVIYYRPAVFIEQHKNSVPIPANQAPTAHFTMTYGTNSASSGQTLNITVNPGGSATITFDGSSSTDPDGVITDWVWVTATTTDGEVIVATTPTFTKTFTAGTYIMVLAVTDNQGSRRYSATSSLVISEGATSPPPQTIPSWAEVTASTQPPYRISFAMAYDRARGEVVLFGGHTGLCVACQLDDTWVWNGQTWVERYPTHKPPPTAWHAMAYDSVRGRVVMFGGIAIDGHYSNDTWTWDGSDWHQIITPVSPSGVGRVGHGMVFDELRGVTVLFGGSGYITTPYYNMNYKDFNDTWEFNGSTWVERPIAQGVPDARQHFAMAYDRNDNQTVLFGGCVINSEGRCVEASDTWVWNGEAWTLQNPLVRPSPRIRAVMTFDPATQSVLMFGGYNYAQNQPGNQLADTWQWVGNTWVALRVEGSVPTMIGSSAGDSGAVLVADEKNHSSVLLLGMLKNYIYSTETWVLR